MKKILLVDDSSTMLLMEQMALGAGGYQVVTARDGESAIRAAATHQPDLVVLDVIMPKMDGFEVCRRLREQEVTRETPIVMLTTRSETINLEKGFRHGCTEYLVKPIQGPELLAKVRSLLGE